MTLRIATCQFPVSANVKRNCAAMLKQIEQATQRGAELVHFGECALSGYCGIDFKAWSAYDWDQLRACTHQVLQSARKHGVWVVFGSSHRLTGEHLPHNSVYVVNADGCLVTRYDKRRCSVKDLSHYTPGTQAITFELGGIKFGILICLDYRFPELYREYQDMGADCVLHSFHDARKQARVLSSMIAPPTMQGHAGNTAMWISVANNSAAYQAFSSLFIDPTGAIQASAKRHRADVLISELNLTGQREYVEMVRTFRAQARSGEIYHSKFVNDPRSQNRTGL